MSELYNKKAEDSDNLIETFPAEQPGTWQCNGKHSRENSTETIHTATNARQRRENTDKFGCEAWTAVQATDDQTE